MNNARGTCFEAHGYFGMVLLLPSGCRRFPSSGVQVLACRAVQVHAMNDGKHTFALTHLLILSSACNGHMMLCCGRGFKTVRDGACAHNRWQVFGVAMEYAQHLMIFTVPQ